MFIFKFILIVLLSVLVFSAIVGAVAFLKDIHRFKSDLEFSGSRKDLINYLVTKERENNVD